MSYHYHSPLDPNCPEVSEFHQMHSDDPISKMCGCMDEVIKDFERAHRQNCDRCLNYGVTNIEVTD